MKHLLNITISLILHISDQKAILQLRKIKKIKRLIYVSCNPEAARKNFFDLGRPESKTLQGEPFVPIKAVPVDMFPHTKHCELVILFERFDIVMQREEKIKKENEEQTIKIKEEEGDEEEQKMKIKEEKGDEEPKLDADKINQETGGVELNKPLEENVVKEEVVDNNQ